jgi:FAD:protein FMN transferase
VTDSRSFSMTALGSSVHVLLAQRASLDQARRVTDAELAAVDAACSRFRDDSDLARINRAGGAAVAVSELCVVAIEGALRAARETDGDVDPTIGRAVRLAGYDRDFSSLPAALPARPFVARHVPAWQRVVVDPSRRTVTVPEGVELDLGATAKALAADRVACALHRALGVGALVSLGGDVATAGPPPVGGWRIGVSDDHRTPLESVSQTVSLVSGGLATSSTTVRRWRVGDDMAHHVIDPRTALPAAGRWRTVSVAAGSCVDANIASTAAIIRSERAPGWLSGLGLPARLVTAAAEVVCVGGWPVAEAAA